MTRDESFYPLRGKVALVTGAGKGFGWATAEKLLECGANVILHYRESAAGCEALAKRFPDHTMVAQGDLTSPGTAGSLVELATHRFQRVDILVNNAGRMTLGPFPDSSEDEWRADIDVNLFAPLRVTHAVVPGMIERGGGKIVNIASQLAIGGWDKGSVYAATKGFILTWTKSLAAELGKHGINVNAVGPGSIVTDMNREIYSDDEVSRAKAARLPLRRLGSPSDVAEAVAFLASPASDFVTGQMLSPNGGSQM